MMDAKWKDFKRHACMNLADMDIKIMIVEFEIFAVSLLLSCNGFIDINTGTFAKI